MHLMAGFLLLVMGFLTWLVPDSVKQQEFSFLNNAGLAYSLLGLAILVICIFFNKKVLQGRGNFMLRVLELAALTPVIIYSLIQKWYLPAAYSGAAFIGIVLAYYLEKNGKKSRIAVFNDEGAHIPGLGSKSHMPWKDLERVLMRHRILTIDCKDNKLFQLDIETVPGNFSAEDFEAYCKVQVEAKKHLYKSDW